MSRSLLASAASWAYREITAVALAVHDEEVYDLNTTLDNIQVFDAFRQLDRTGHANYSRVVRETTKSDLSCLKVRTRGDMVALPISRSMRTGRSSFHGSCFEERPAETFCIEQTYTISISTTSGALQPNTRVVESTPTTARFSYRRVARLIRV